MNQAHLSLLYRHLAAENAHDLDGTLATLHAECRFEDHATGQVWHGREGAADHYRQWWRCFDVAVARDAGQNAGWASESVYVAEATWRGTHTGDFLGVAASGRPIVQSFVVVVTFKDDLMFSESFYYDLSSLMRQVSDDRWPELSSLPHARK
jgi:steroid delta-isomerase-like uncharacterized protein